MMIEKGIKNSKKITVSDALTAQNVGSGTLPVFATPAMAALMEACAAESVEALLEGNTSVGTHLELSHLSADPVGAEVVCESELCEVDGRKLKFRLTVSDRFGVVGTAVHERVIIDPERFMQKVSAKL